MFRSNTAREEQATSEQYRPFEATTNPLELFSIAADTGASLLKLFLAELKLSLSEAPMLGVMFVLLIPFVIFAWLGLSVLGAWLVCVYSESVGWAITAFTALQLACCAGLAWRIKAMSGKISFPASRRQLEKLFPGQEP